MAEARFRKQNGRMIPVTRQGGVRSPRRGHTIQQLERLQADNWHNPDTGTEISEGEGDEYLLHLRQKKADRDVSNYLKALSRGPGTGGRTRSQGRPYLTGPVQFRMINGNRVPFRGTFEPSL